MSESSEHAGRDQGSPARRSRRRRANGEGSIWPRKDGRYGYAAYVLTTAGTYKRVQGYARSHEDARYAYLYWTSQNAWQMPVLGTEAREPRKVKSSIEERKTLVPALQHVPHRVPDTHETRCGKPRIPACLRPKTQYR